MWKVAVFFFDREQTSMTEMERSNHSTIDDMGYRMEFDYRPGSNHHIRFWQQLSASHISSAKHCFQKPDGQGYLIVSKRK